MNCPNCNRVVELQAIDCRECGESLTTWRTLQASSAQVRQRGLHQAAQEDFLGATVSFLVAAFANPLETDAWLDAGRALVRLGQVPDALRLLETVRRRAPQSDAAALMSAIRQLADEPSEQERQPTAHQEPVEVPINVSDAANEIAPVCEAATSPVGSPTPRELLSWPPLARKRSFLQRMSGNSSDTLWDSVLAVEGRASSEAIGGNGWLRHLAQEDVPHGAVLYIQGLDGWQRNDFAGAQQWFIRSVQMGTPYLNPVGYILCCAMAETTKLLACLNQLREFGIQADEIRQVIHEIRTRSISSQPRDCPAQLQQIEQLISSIA